MRYKIVCLTPIYNEEPNLEFFLKENSKFVDGFVFLDDASSDNSLNVAKKHPKTINVLKNKKRKGFNDLKNRNKLLDYASKLDSEWFIFLDADEILDKTYFKEFKKILKSRFNLFELRLIHLWNSNKKYNSQYPFSENGVQYKLRLFRKKYFMKINGEKLHFKLKPYGGFIRRSIALIKHYANISKDHRIKRYINYTSSFDPHHKFQKSYDHLLVEETNLKKVKDLYFEKNIFGFYKKPSIILDIIRNAQSIIYLNFIKKIFNFLKKF